MKNSVVLLVEDNDDDIELTLRSFQKQTFANQIVVARNGQEALDYLFEREGVSDRPGPPALILLDLKLPKIDGLEVLRKIRNHAATRYIPVVVLSTSSQSTDKFQSYGNGANSYIRKPMDYDQFLEITRQLGVYWLMINEPPPKMDGDHPAL